jgi:hypothetical protein
MSIPVELPDLAATLARYRHAYLMTTSDAGAPHAVAVNAVLQDGELVAEPVGNRTRQNAVARPAVGLVWPPLAEGDYSLIVDGRATVTGAELRIKPTRAVLHRPAPSPATVQAAADGSACGSDCVPLRLDG